MMAENVLNSMQVLFQKAQIESLLINKNQTLKWESYKKDIIDVEDRLKLFLQDLNVPILVPVGNKALFRGKLVHTNDILISLGDGYFTKGSVDQSLEIIARRKVKCDEMLKNLEKEKHLLESRANLHRDKDLFPNEEGHEIFEEFIEDEEEIWRKEHRKKVKDYKQNIAKLKQDEPSEIKTDEDLWKRLELLEMEEELNDELDRLEDEEVESSDDSNDESSDDDVSADSNMSDDTQKPIIVQSHITNNPVSIMKHRHSSNDRTLQTKESEVSDEEFIKIEFKHSSVKPVVTECEYINSPFDIYSKFSDAINKKKKMSRRVSFADLPEVKTYKSDIPVETNQEFEEVPVAFGDVVERTVPVDFKVSESRPVSKFKASRNLQRDNYYKRNQEELD